MAHQTEEEETFWGNKRCVGYSRGREIDILKGKKVKIVVDRLNTGEKTET